MRTTSIAIPPQYKPIYNALQLTKPGGESKKLRKLSSEISRIVTTPAQYREFLSWLETYQPGLALGCVKNNYGLTENLIHSIQDAHTVSDSPEILKELFGNHLIASRILGELKTADGIVITPTNQPWMSKILDYAAEMHQFTHSAETEAKIKPLLRSLLTSPTHFKAIHASDDYLAKKLLRKFFSYKNILTELSQTELEALLETIQVLPLPYFSSEDDNPHNVFILALRGAKQHLAQFDTSFFLKLKAVYSHNAFHLEFAPAAVAQTLLTTLYGSVEALIELNSFLLRQVMLNYRDYFYRLIADNKLMPQLLEKHYEALVSCFDYEKVFSLVTTIDDLLAIDRYFQAHRKDSYPPKPLEIQESTEKALAHLPKTILHLCSTPAALNSIYKERIYWLMRAIEANRTAIIKKFGMHDFCELKTAFQAAMIKKEPAIIKTFVETESTFDNLMSLLHACDHHECKWERSIDGMKNAIHQRAFKLFQAMLPEERIAHAKRHANLAILFTTDDLKKISELFTEDGALKKLAKANHYFTWRMIKVNLPHKLPSETDLAQLQSVNTLFKPKIDKKIAKTEAKKNAPPSYGWC